MRNPDVADDLDWTTPVTTDSNVLPTPHQRGTETKTDQQITLADIGTDDQEDADDEREVEFTPLVFVGVSEDTAAAYQEALDAARFVLQETRDPDDDNSLYHISEKLPEMPDQGVLCFNPREVDDYSTYVRTARRVLRKNDDLVDGPTGRYVQDLTALEEHFEDALDEMCERILRAVETTEGVSLKFLSPTISSSYVRCTAEESHSVSVSPHTKSGETDYLLTPSGDRRSLYRFWIAQAFAYKTNKRCVVVPTSEVPEPDAVSESSESNEETPASAKADAPGGTDEDQMTLSSVS